MSIEHDNRVIVVGVDGSTGSLRAMRWAIGEASLRGCAIEAVTVWHAGSYDAATRQAAEDLRAQVVKEACSDVSDGRPISEEIETGVPEEVLVARSQRASLLVIGSHGVGSIRHAALGSTSEYCSRMAACPVVVLPTPADGDRHTEIAER